MSFEVSSRNVRLVTKALASVASDVSGAEASGGSVNSSPNFELATSSRSSESNMARPCVIELSAESSVTFLWRSDSASARVRLCAAASAIKFRLIENVIDTLVTMNRIMK